MMVLDLLVAEGDLVVGRGVIEGTHQGPFLGVPPTNKRIRWTGTRMFRVKNGKVIGVFTTTDACRALSELSRTVEGDH